MAGGLVKLSTQLGKFLLAFAEPRGGKVNAFVFDFFPRSISTLARANWEQQNTTIGVKPIAYTNRDPQRLSIDELWLDKTDSGESIRDDINALLELHHETKNGTPPLLLAIYGEDGEVRPVVVEEIRIEETFFNSFGEPLRARVSLQLLEHQELNERNSSNARDDVDFSDEGNGSGRRPFGPQF
jgi:hypothetical protein